MGQGGVDWVGWGRAEEVAEGLGAVEGVGWGSGAGWGEMGRGRGEDCGWEGRAERRGAQDVGQGGLWVRNTRTLPETARGCGFLIQSGATRPDVI